MKKLPFAFIGVCLAEPFPKIVSCVGNVFSLGLCRLFTSTSQLRNILDQGLISSNFCECSSCDFSIRHFDHWVNKYSREVWGNQPQICFVLRWDEKRSILVLPVHAWWTGIRPEKQMNDQNLMLTSFWRTHPLSPSPIVVTFHIPELVTILFGFKVKKGKITLVQKCGVCSLNLLKENLSKIDAIVRNVQQPNTLAIDRVMCLQIKVELMKNRQF